MEFDMNYTLRMADLKDEEAICDLLSNHFYPDEIFTMRINSTKCMITPDEEDLMKEQIRRDVRCYLKNRFLCIVAIHQKTNEIIGVQVSILIFNLLAEYETTEPSNNLKLMQIVRPFMKELFERAAIHKKFSEVKKALYLDIIAVHKNHRQRGLCRILTEQAIEWAKKNDIDLAYGVSTTPYSKRVAEKLGFKSILDYDLQTFRNSDGCLVFPDIKPHDVFSVVVIEIKK